MRTLFYSRPLVYSIVVASLLGYFAITITTYGQSVKKTAKQADFQFREGDVVFQSTQSRQCNAIKLATHSPYSHCGIYLKGTDGKAYIYEAVQPVKRTPLKQWIAQGNGGEFAVVRLKNASSVLNDSSVALLKKEANKYINKDYDIHFGWGDDRIYCSEYVWKVYKNALGLELGSLRTMKDFDLTSKEVKDILKQRYGNQIPYDEKVIAPSDLYSAPIVEVVE